MGVGESEAVSGELHHHHLHAQADAEIGDFELSRDARRGDHSLHAALAEASRHDDAVKLADAFGVDFARNPLRLQPLDLGRCPDREASVAYGLTH